MQMQSGFNHSRETIAAAALLLIFSSANAAQAHTSSALSGPVSAQTSEPAPAATFVIFPDRGAPAGLLPALVTTLREQIAAHAAELRPMLGATIGVNNDIGSDPRVEILLSDELVPGQPVQHPITVYLHGDCNIVPQPSLDPFADVLPSTTLGWVYREHGHVESFVHVECGHIADVLSSHTFGLTREQRTQKMALAISRVILHEWIHVEKQSAHHAEHGLAKAQFSAADLIGNPAPMVARDNARKPAQ